MISNYEELSKQHDEQIGADERKKIGEWLEKKLRAYDVRFPTEICVAITMKDIELLKQGKEI